MTLPLASVSGDRFLEANPALLAVVRLHILTRPGEEDQQPTLHEKPLTFAEESREHHAREEHAMRSQEDGFQAPPLCRMHSGRPQSLCFKMEQRRLCS